MNDEFLGERFTINLLQFIYRSANESILFLSSVNWINVIRNDEREGGRVE